MHDQVLEDGEVIIGQKPSVGQLCPCHTWRLEDLQLTLTSTPCSTLQ